MTRQQRRAEAREAAKLLLKTGKPEEPFSWAYTLALVLFAVGIFILDPPKTQAGVLRCLVAGFAALIYPARHLAWWVLQNKLKRVQTPAAIILSAVLISTIGYRIWPPVRRHTLTAKERALFEKPLSEQKEPREEIQVVCAQGDEHACVYAAQFVNIFREAGWKVEGNRAEPVRMNNASDGIILFKHGEGKLDPDKWNSGLWSALTASLIDVHQAFVNIGIEPDSAANPELAEGVISIYFGLEKEDEGTPTNLSKSLEKLGNNYRGGSVPPPK